MNIERIKASALAMLTSADHPPEYTARGVGVGLLVGLSPTLGVQIPLLMGLGAALRKSWPFHVPLSLLCTLPTNLLTAPFVYYVYVVTGRVMLGRFDRLRGFEVFSQRLSGAIASDDAWYEQLWLTAVGLFQEFGAPLILGSIPWSVAGGYLGYRLTLKFVRRRQALHSK